MKYKTQHICNFEYVVNDYILEQQNKMAATFDTNVYLTSQKLVKIVLCSH